MWPLEERTRACRRCSVKAYPQPTDATTLLRTGVILQARSTPCPYPTRMECTFEWSEATESSFDNYPCSSLPKVWPWASSVGLGCVLSQVQEDGLSHLRISLKNYGISELEGCEIFPSLFAWSPDHAACLSILQDHLGSLALTIQEMDLTIKHKPGKAMQTHSPEVNQIVADPVADDGDESHPEEDSLSIPSVDTVPVSC